MSETPDEDAQAMEAKLAGAGVVMVVGFAEKDCVRARQRNHSPLRGEPKGYVAWHEWAERKSKTHRQRRCPDCGIYAIWEERP